MKVFQRRINPRLYIPKKQKSEGTGSGSDTDLVAEAFSKEGSRFDAIDRSIVNALGFVNGLTKRLQTGTERCDFVIKIIDCSSSMTINDTFIASQKNIPQKASRWHELCHHLAFGHHFFSGFQITSELTYWPSGKNPGIKTTSKPYLLAAEMLPLLSELKNIIPIGPSNIPQTINHVTRILQEKRQTQSGYVLLVIYTDGSHQERANHRLSAMLQKFDHLHSHFELRVVVRLTTGDEQTISLYNEYDKKALPFEFDVIGNCVQENKEYQLAGNDYLISSPILSEWRTIGCGTGLMDSLDEKPLIPAEIRDLVAAFLKIDPGSLGTPEKDPHGLTNAVTALNNSLTEPVIDIKRLEKALTEVKNSLHIQRL